MTTPTAAASTPEKPKRQPRRYYLTAEGERALQGPSRRIHQPANRDCWTLTEAGHAALDFGLRGDS